MAKTLTVAALIATAALCFTALVGFAQAEDGSPSPSPGPSPDSGSPLAVEGKVYCDTCRVKFETSLSEPVEGAQVKLVCKNRETEEMELEMEEETDESGHYRFDVEGDHEDDICEVHLVKSPKDDCNEIVHGWNAARVSLTRDVGLVESVRHANALGFMKKEAVKDCAGVLKSMGFLPV